MDLAIAQLGGTENVVRPAPMTTPQPGRGMGAQRPRTPHQFTGGHVTEKGLRAIEDYCAAVREKVGWSIPIATDHYGSFNVENIIKFAQAVDKFNLAWLEDTVPWQFADDLVRIKNSCKTPILTGEDIYLATGFKELFEKRAISIAHPDPAECGGILESKKIADLAAQYGIATAFHNHNNPTTLFASVHAAAACGAVHGSRIPQRRPHGGVFLRGERRAEADHQRRLRGGAGWARPGLRLQPGSSQEMGQGAGLLRADQGVGQRTVFRRPVPLAGTENTELRTQEVARGARFGTSSGAF